MDLLELFSIFAELIRIIAVYVSIGLGALLGLIAGLYWLNAERR